MNRFLLVVPAHNEAAHLPAVLASLAAQTLDRDCWRVVIVDDSSTDATAEIARAWLATERIAGEVMQVAARSIPRALNAGIALARANECIVRLDAHTIYGADYLARIDAAFTRLGAHVWMVGGAQIPAPAASFSHRLVVSLMTSRMGLGGAAFRTATVPQQTTSVYLGAFRPGVLARVGGYDERWQANEDAELAARIAAAGGEIWWIPLQSVYRVNRGPLKTLSQLARYGYWRGRTLRRHPHLARPRHTAPPVALLGASVLLARGAVRTVALGALVYGAAVIAQRPRDEARTITAAALVFFPLAHVAFAAGLLRGLLTFGRST